jgi:hypothetical protein
MSAMDGIRSLCVAAGLCSWLALALGCRGEASRPTAHAAADAGGDASHSNVPHSSGAMSDAAPSGMDAAIDSGASATRDAGTMGGGLCVPGMSVACAGPRGCVGFQVCNAAGKAFGSCDCGPFDAGALSDSGDGGSGDGRVLLQGTIQKGPFLLGSSVLLAAVDSTGASTGQVFSTTTSDNLGHFFVELRYAGYLDMQAQGFYYDEGSGGLSTAPIVLRALYDAATGRIQDAHINIVTHLARNRALRLMMTAGKSFEDAEAQAEGELQAALALGGTGFNPQGIGVSLDELGADNEQNAYLFAVSAVLLQAARDRAASGPVDAQLQQLIDTIAADLASSGALAAGMADELHKAEQHLDVDLTMDLFQARLTSVGSDLAPANLDRSVDSDGDGYRNSVDTCPLVANANQAQLPADVVCNAVRHYSVTPDAAVPALGQGWYGVVLGDFDGDGDDDVVAVDYARVSFYRSDGGRFAAPVTTATVVNTDSPYSLSAWDANGDGKLDLITRFGWTAGDGFGHFATEVPWPNPMLAPDGGQVNVGACVVDDFDGDGLPDVARAIEQVPSKPFLAVSMGTAKGTFAAPKALDVFGTDLVTWIAAARINGDSHLDLVVNGSTAGALLGDGHGGFVPSTPVDLRNSQPFIGDFNGDGKVDIAQALYGSVAVALGDGNGGFGAPVTTPSTLAWATDGFVAADFNGDGKTDLVGSLSDSQWTSYTPALLLSRGTTFAAVQPLRNTGPAVLPSNGNSVWALYAGDVNGDRRPDVVWLSLDLRHEWSIQAHLMGVHR